MSSEEPIPLTRPRRRRRKTRLERLLHTQALNQAQSPRGPSLPHFEEKPFILIPTSTLDSDHESDPPPHLPSIKAILRQSTLDVSPPPPLPETPVNLTHPPLDDVAIFPESLADPPVPEMSPPRPRPKRSRPSRIPSRVPRSALGLILRVGALSGILVFLIGVVVYQLSRAVAVDSETTSPEITLGSQSLIQLGQFEEPLQNQLQPFLQQPGFSPHAMFVDLDTAAYVDLNASRPIAAASVIKVPILVAFFQAVDQGIIGLDEMLVLKKEQSAGGSGVLQSQPIGTEIPALEAATLMITVSDNTATNLIVDRLGGMDTLNRTFQRWGLKDTQLVWQLPDLEGTNKTSALDMIGLLAKIEEGKLLTPRSRDRVLDIMRRTQTTPLLSEGLGEGARLANKTGNIKDVVGDVGIIDMPNGKRYLAAVLVEREPNDPQGQQVVRDLSRAVYDYWLAADSESELN